MKILDFQAELQPAPYPVINGKKLAVPKTSVRCFICSVCCVLFIYLLVCLLV